VKPYEQEVIPTCTAGGRSVLAPDLLRYVYYQLLLQQAENRFNLMITILREFLYKNVKKIYWYVSSVQ
jgi:hypothetical protein